MTTHVKPFIFSLTSILLMAFDAVLQLSRKGSVIDIVVYPVILVMWFLCPEITWSEWRYISICNLETTINAKRYYINNMQQGLKQGVAIFTIS